jgi:hypothetical protein
MLMHPDEGLVQLKELAARGVGIHLPKILFRSVSFPARLKHSVNLNDRPVGLRLTAESLRIERATFWSIVSVRVQGAPPETPSP